MAFLEDSLQARGYDIRHFSALKSAYHREPTPLQLASYDVHVLKTIVLYVHYKDSSHLREILSCGISPSACNKYGETMVHRVSKAGNLKLLTIFLECGASVQVASDYGRTPLHEVCMATKPSFESFEEILKRDPRLLFMTDARGATPMAYIRKEYYDPWIRFFAGILDTYWPRRDVRHQGPELPPPLALEKPDSIPIRDPRNALPIKLASQVAAGTMDPREASLLNVTDPGTKDYDDYTTDKDLTYLLYDTLDFDSDSDYYSSDDSTDSGWYDDVDDETHVTNATESLCLSKTVNQDTKLAPNNVLSYSPRSVIH